jgi:eukaryotic-like serine/threonine-protein kinase
MTTMTQLGKYQIKRQLGKGAMGIVYEGFDPLIERTVAIKTILPAQLNSSEAADVLARFKREAQAAGRLNHPNIVGIYEYGEVVAQDDSTMMAAPGNAPAGERVAFIAMEFVKGKELRDYLEANDRFALPEVARIMGEMLDALEHAHANGVVHRDMKPANVILLDGGKVKVADFGIARIEASQLTQAGTVMGTPSYMSPEQFMGQTVDSRSDIFSCGVILYQFLTGEKPFTGSTTTIMYKVLREEPTPPSELNITLPKGLDAVVHTALAKNPAQRYQTAGEFAQAIRNAVYGLSVSPDFALLAPGDDTVPRSPQQAAVAAAKAPLPKPTVAPDDITVPGVQAPKAFVSAAVQASPEAAAQPPRSKAPLWIAATAGVMALAGGAYVLLAGSNQPGVAQQSATPVAAAPAPAQPAGPSVVVSAPAAPVAAEPVAEPGTLVISAVGVADSKDPKFNGDAAAAQSHARDNAKRHLVEKALALYVDAGSLDKNREVLEQKLLNSSGSFIQTVIREGAVTPGANGLMESETRAVVRVRDVQKSLNQLSREERIDFIRKQGDPKVSLQMVIRSGEGAQALPPERSQLAENVLKQRIKSFGFRVWSPEGEAKVNDKAKIADFEVQGEVRLKLLSAKLAASGLTITKSVLTSWTIKAVDKSSGEEIYLNTVLPKNQSWASEEQALADIGKQVGDEFSRGFFLQHFNYGTQKISLTISGLPDAALGNLLLRELRASRQVLDVQSSETGKYTVHLADGSASDIVQEALVAPLNAKLGQACLALAGSAGGDVSVSFAPACATAQARSKLEGAPAGSIRPVKASV